MCGPDGWGLLHVEHSATELTTSSSSFALFGSIISSGCSGWPQTCSPSWLTIWDFRCGLPHPAPKYFSFACSVRASGVQGGRWRPLPCLKSTLRARESLLSPVSSNPAHVSSSLINLSRPPGHVCLRFEAKRAESQGLTWAGSTESLRQG